ncbi:TRAP transporter small permease subunit [Piscinibacter sp.]|uniref:TRAP transporter small permease subunit n=1 Tax=Piscinibacter sp. TaxID=1903157 RepID=UPI002BDBD9C5|nr:TRAP transporter small permease subunit [Albitalea sp.]HUG24350.1 TRAP transporter small permease subunit [Albitalea sp.]
MSFLLLLSRAIDRLNEFIGRWLAWLVLAAVLISAVNAAVRKLFNMSSNAYLEIQWYLFAAIFLIAAGYTLLRNDHVKIDVILGRFSRRTQVKVEIFGLLVFLMPFVVTVMQMTMPLVIQAYHSGEMSNNAGGLIRWPVYAMVPIGFALLGLQGTSELVKRVAFLMGLIDDPATKAHVKTPEEQLVEDFRRQAEAEAAAEGARK